MDSNANCEVAAIRITGKHGGRAKGGGGGEENGNTAVRAKGLIGGAVCRGPEGLATPVGSPLLLFGSRGAVGLEEGKDVSGSTAEVGPAEQWVSQATDVMEAEGDLAKKGRGR